MDKYNERKKIIDDFLEREEVIDSEEKASAYTLFNSIKEKLQPLYDINHNTEFENNMENACLKGNLVRGAMIALGNLRCNIHTSFNIDDNAAGIIVEFKKPEYASNIFGFNSSNTRLVYVIARKYGRKELYFPTKYYYNKDYLEDSIIMDCYDEIQHTFDVLESTYAFLGNKYPNYEPIDKDDDTFALNMIIKDDGSFECDLEFSTDDPIDETKFYGFKTINEIISQNQDEILKRIPIKVSSLASTFKNAYLEKLNNSDFQKVK